MQGDSPESDSRSRLSHRSFDTWDIKHESLEQVEARIHDGVPPADLHARAKGYASGVGRYFPFAQPSKGAAMMEIGSGVGYILEAMLNRYKPSRLIGLDVAPGMLEKAKERLRRDDVKGEAIEFLLYDGKTIPLEDESLDFVYSVASLQHVPRPFMFQVLLETYRVLKNGGRCYIHLLAYSHFKQHSDRTRFAGEVRQQVHEQAGHWHHYYTFDELYYVASYGIEATQIDIVEDGGSLYLTFGKGFDRKYARAELDVREA